MNDIALAEFRFNASKRALGILNTMRDSKFRTKHRSRVMSNMNRLRAAHRRLVELDEMLIELGIKVKEEPQVVIETEVVEVLNSRF